MINLPKADKKEGGGRRAQVGRSLKRERKELSRVENFRVPVSTGEQEFGINLCVSFIPGMVDKSPMRFVH